MESRFDGIVIGSGQAGPFLAARLAGAGMKIALVEREHLGGTCVNDGCMPTKTLVASARAAHVVRTAADHGVLLPGAPSIDMKIVKARKDAIVGQAVANLTNWLGGLPNMEVIRGHGRFVGPHRVEVDGRVLEAPKVFINVGGGAVLPDVPGVADVEVLTNTSILELDAVPAHLVVLGGSYIGLEFAQIYRRFGAQVTVIEAAPRLIAREDPEVSGEVQAMLESEGVAFHLSARLLRLHKGAGGSGVRIDIECDGGERQLDASHLLVAIGRRPNTSDLGLEHAGIAIDARGFIPVDDELRTSVPGIWALGDVHGRGAFTHTSYNDFEIVAANLLDEGPRSLRDRIPAYALFTDPPLGRIGMTEAEVRASGRPALVGRMPMTRVGRAKERGETRGFMKVLVDAQTERVLGAAMLCIEGDEIVHSLLDVMYCQASYRVVERAVHIHPTVTELIPTLLQGLAPLAAAA